VAKKLLAKKVVAGKATAAALPVGRPGPKFEEKNLPEWDDASFKGELNELPDLVDEVAVLQAERAEIDARLKEKMAVVRALMEGVNDLESWSVRAEGGTACYIKPKPRETIVVERLIEQGVSWKVIQKATKKTPVTPFATVVARKTSEPDQDE